MNVIRNDLSARRLVSETLARLLLASVPEELRESFAGDLCERLERDVLPRRGLSGARRWLVTAILRSMPAMIYRRATAGGPRAGARWLAGAVIATFGSVQAWDSNAHRSSPLVIALVAVAVAIPAATVVLSARRGPMFAALGSAFVLLTVARLVAPAPLAGLHLVLIPVYALCLALSPAAESRWFGRRSSA
jgi:hypothetical protein